MSWDGTLFDGTTGSAGVRVVALHHDQPQSKPSGASPAAATSFANTARAGCTIAGSVTRID